MVRDDDLKVAARMGELDGEDSVAESDLDEDALAISDQEDAGDEGW